MNPDGSGITRLTNNGTVEYFQAWMPDGRILYTSTSWLGENIQHLYTMKPDGTDNREIPLPANIGDLNSPIVSSDGRFIFFDDADSALWVMYADGSAATNMGIGAGNVDYHPGP